MYLLPTGVGALFQAVPLEEVVCVWLGLSALT